MMRDDQSGHVARGEFACTCQRNQEVISFVTFDIVASQLCNGFGPNIRKSWSKHNALELGQLTHINGSGVAAKSTDFLCPLFLCQLVDVSMSRAQYSCGFQGLGCHDGRWRYQKGPNNPDNTCSQTWQPNDFRFLMSRPTARQSQGNYPQALLED